MKKEKSIRILQSILTTEADNWRRKKSILLPKTTINDTTIGMDSAGYKQSILSNSRIDEKSNKGKESLTSNKK